MAMTYKAVFEYFKDKRDTPCPLTEELISRGFQQPCSEKGYRIVARVSDIVNPTQWWHLMQYCLAKYELHKEDESYRYTPCGELIFWMAEVSGVVDSLELKGLMDELTQPTVVPRKDGNAEIKAVCWDKIKSIFD